MLSNSDGQTQEKLLKHTELLDLLQIKHKTLANLVTEHPDFPCYTVGRGSDLRGKRFLLSEVLAFLKRKNGKPTKVVDLPGL